MARFRRMGCNWCGKRYRYTEMIHKDGNNFCSSDCEEKLEVYMEA